MIKVKHILTLVLIYFSISIYSQTNIDLAYKNFKEKNYLVARDFINKVILEENINKDPQVWQLRALIYRKLTDDLGIVARDSAMLSLDEATTLDLKGEFTEKINGYRKNIVSDYYNDAVIYLESGKCLESEKSYVYYKELYTKYVEESKDFTSQDVEYYLALSSKYESLSKNESNEEKRNALMENSLKALVKVLDLDKENYEANLRLGIMYYNRGVHLILSLTPDVDIEQCIETNRKSVEIFDIALPYFLTAYKTNPNKIEIIEGLAGIYTNLNNKEKAAEFMELLKQFDK